MLDRMYFPVISVKTLTVRLAIVLLFSVGVSACGGGGAGSDSNGTNGLFEPIEAPDNTVNTPDDDSGEDAVSTSFYGTITLNDLRVPSSATPLCPRT